MRSRRIGWLAVPVVAVALMAFAGCPSISDPWEGQAGKHVLASFAPIYCFAQNVAGPDAAVKIVSADQGPHGFNPTPHDIMLVKRADLFVISGLELDDAIAKRMIGGADNKSVKLVEAASAIPVKELREGEKDEDDKDKGEEEHHHHGKYDPHVWLGVPEAVKMVGKIRDSLKEIDPVHAGGYDNRAAAYVAKLEQLQKDGKEMLKDKKQRKLVTFHDSMGYFARGFDLEIVDCIEIAPGVEPSGKKIQQLIKVCQEHQIRLIGVEPQYPSNTSAQVLLTELKNKGINATFVELDPLETAKPADLTPEFYERKMRENLKNLAEAMK
ncbi:MAG: metal ABC transporter substrate-binding protein [Gemmataceae bacterium]